MIEHQGIIANISDKKISVKILQQSACSSCHAKGACMAADSKEKMVDVTDSTGKYKINDLVTIEGKESMGYKAVLWAFVIPVFILVLILILATSVWKWGEVEAAIASILALAPYYLILYLLRHKMANSFKFTIKNFN
ncbi:MAG: SoxR reducing system RseC family protein [Petrimonas sp.]|uniref:SoxR reducing system RseC family protein n=1 Tax=Petrimonas sp. TaxID=2023866 RepID=UPI001BD34456|nr:SoxR reducing system RseC family protein [Petrimonas sp.]